MDADCSSAKKPIEELEVSIKLSGYKEVKEQLDNISLQLNDIETQLDRIITKINKIKEVR